MTDIPINEYAHLLFLSYAWHGEARDEHGVVKEASWIGRFHERLQVAVDCRIPNALVWRDRKQIINDEDFDKHILPALRKADLMLPVACEPFFTSKNTHKEIEKFVELNNPASSFDKHLIVYIQKAPHDVPTLDNQKLNWGYFIECLDNRSSYKFYKPSGRGGHVGYIDDVGDIPKDYAPTFHVLISELADELKRRLRNKPRRAAPESPIARDEGSAPPPRKKVFLATTGLRDNYRQLRHTLEAEANAEGETAFSVDPPEDGGVKAAEIEAATRDAVAAFHLLPQDLSQVDDADRDQLKATARRPGLRRYIWAIGQSVEKVAKFLQDCGGYGENYDNIIVGNFEHNLRSTAEKLRREDSNHDVPLPAERKGGMIDTLLICEPMDIIPSKGGIDFARIQKALHAERLDCERPKLPRGERDKFIASKALRCDAIAIYVGRQNREWLRKMVAWARNFQNLQRSSAFEPIVVIENAAPLTKAARTGGSSEREPELKLRVIASTHQFATFPSHGS